MSADFITCEGCNTIISKMSVNCRICGTKLQDVIPAMPDPRFIEPAEELAERTKPPAFVGFLTLALGLFAVLVAAGIIPTTSAQADTPWWVISAAGAVFILAGGMVLAQRVESAFANSLCGALAILFLAVVANWVAFADKPTTGGTATQIGGLSFPSGNVLGTVQPIAFGIVAISLDFLVVFTWILFYRRYRPVMVETESIDRAH